MVRISVVIPQVNEEAHIAQSIERAWKCGADEVIIVDGGSTDSSLQIIENTNCKLIHSNPGRGIQQNAGARASSGDVILFLHADTWLEAGACNQIRERYVGNPNVWGGFHQQIANPRKIYRWIEKGNALRVRWRGLIYGDQGIFVGRSLLDSLGGFPDEPLMEDFMLARKLKKYSAQLLPGPLHVDARRWEANGPIRQTIRNWIIVNLFYLGVQPATLARIYHRHDRD